MQRTSQGSDMGLCVHCGYSGADVIFSCPNKCSYHARCLDLFSVQQNCLTIPAGTQVSASSCHIKVCLNCNSQANSLEIIPLALDSIKIGRSQDNFAISAGKRSYLSDSLQSEHGYDLNTPRTGRWVPAEIVFRDTLLSHFTSGSLPLREEYKLIDFLSDILKSKQSRLTKKMKHANLSVQHYCFRSGFLSRHLAVELSRMEHEFICSLPDHEQQEIKFHMNRLWREHLADRLAVSTIPFDPNRWIDSVEMLEKCLNDKHEQERMVKRRIMMGKAWHVDSNTEQGVFVDNMEEVGDVDFESFMSSIEGENGTKGELGNSEIQNIFSSFAKEAGHTPSITSDTSEEEHKVYGASAPASSQPNFRFAAPFLAWIISYMERTNIPFEHVDIWCPSSLPSDECGRMAPPPSTLGSGLSVPPNCRLYFAGSASSSKKMTPVKSNPSGSNPHLNSVPMSSEEIESLSLFGHYSEKFSFSNGCGLPGRVFQSGQPEWGQHLSTCSTSSFERRGGAIQFGIQTSVAIPIRCSNVGRIVLSLYSRSCREKDDELINKITRDVEAMNPCPRFKLVVDMGDGKIEASQADERTTTAGPVSQQSPHSQALTATQSHAQASNLSRVLEQHQVSSTSQSHGQNQDRIRALVTFLCENMPSNDASPLSSQLNNIMSLRLLLLKPNRSLDEDHLVESMLVLYQSYLSAQRPPTDITMMLARDFAFHDLQLQRSSTAANDPTQQRHIMDGNSPPHRIVPMPSEQSNSMPYLSLDTSNHSIPGLSSLRGHMSSFSLNSIDHSKNTM